jgi:hypothetical protein
MSIRQLNASYAPEEDRVMLRFTTDIQEEYRFWLTRAVVAALLQHAQTLAVKALEQHHSVQQAKAVADAAGARVKMLRTDSVHAADQFADRSLSFVYIDGDHHSRAVLEDAVLAHGLDLADVTAASGSKISSKARIWAALCARSALGSTPRSSTRCPPVHTVAARA